MRKDRARWSRESKKKGRSQHMGSRGGEEKSGESGGGQKTEREREACVGVGGRG